jgi:hypothetical protein
MSTAAISKKLLIAKGLRPQHDVIMTHDTQEEKSGCAKTHHMGALFLQFHSDAVVVSARLVFCSHVSKPFQVIKLKRKQHF